MSENRARPSGDAIVLEGVEKEYRARGGTEAVRALRGIDLRVPTGGRVAIMGRSGSGKTTLLQILGALDVPTRGRALVAGEDLGGMSERQLQTYRARTVGFVFQNFQLIPILSARENVELAMEALDVPTGERRARALRLLDAVGMGARSFHRPGKLSSGEQQRVAVARALANDPAVLLADEPTGSLDSETGEEVIALIFRLAEERGSTVVVVTHSDEVARRCDVVHRIRDGRIVPDLPPTPAQGGTKVMEPSGDAPSGAPPRKN